MLEIPEMAGQIDSVFETRWLPFIFYFQFDSKQFFLMLFPFLYGLK